MVVRDESRTDVGAVRKANEDAMCSLPGAGVWVVADGMGGHANGQFASQAIVEEVGMGLGNGQGNGAAAGAALDASCQTLADAITRANSRIHAKGQVTGQMGSTVVALVLGEGEFAVLWAGDSRAYLLRDGAMTLLTRDHTQVEDMVVQGKLTAAEAANHPMKHVLSRAVGVAGELELAGVRDATRAGDVFLLCSDGLSGVVPEADIAAMVVKSAERACDELIAACHARGAPDNVTVTLVAVENPGAASGQGEQ